ncbi:MAG: site-specific DNA-methyltransferase [Clostridiaceae bacterium]|nr:site-specific DNA-methyltransferase [Clostridiaceae bacterium]
MTEHRILIGDSKNIPEIPSGSVQLIVTSPPYPMIEMWDEMFGNQDSSINESLSKGDGMNAFYKMHKLLNRTWEECDRILADNGFICINIGDATRTINGDFRLFSNHTQVISFFLEKGYSVLPDIHWRKQSNAPNKFMGSGMYPAGAYVTYEHEYILIFRKGGKRVFKGTGRERRQESAFFWEERNVWFSDLWDIKGTSQVITASKTSRSRSAAYPFEIPYRLVNMYSVKGDTVVDPFMGLGTTTLACMASNRNSIGVEINEEIAELAVKNIAASANNLNGIIDSRINRHVEFIDSLPADKRKRCYKNIPHGFEVITKQETAIKIDRLASVDQNGYIFTCSYE